MRIIAGKYRRRLLKMVPDERTRETQDKVRGAVFNTLQDYVINSSVLDLFAGSGSYGIEAISRGAKSVIFNDINSISIRTIKDNLKIIEENNYQVFQLDYKKLIAKLNLLNINFDLVFIDPPYKLNIYEEVMNGLVNLINPDGIIICEMDKKRVLNQAKISQYKFIKEKIYGSKKVEYYQKI